MSGEMQEMPPVWGIELDGGIPKGWQPFEVIVVMKCMDEEGKVRLGYRSSKGWTEWEALGALTAFATSSNETIQAAMEDAEDDEEDPE